MTSFAFIAGLLPLVFASGAGAIGNRTIGTTGAGGMLMGTVIGVLVIPGLYYLFGKLADGRKLLQDEVNEPLSEAFEHPKTDDHGHAGQHGHAEPPPILLKAETPPHDHGPPPAG
jgi:HAE1 family hydrophobic/amphiphilic exporter-1